MAWHFSSDRPVYLQISERLTKAVLSGQYKPGEQMPTVRQLALESAVNPNTVQKAFTHLESKGILVSKGTSGRFVTDDGIVIETSRKELASQTINKFLKDMKSLSYSDQEILNLLKEVEG